MIFKISMTLVGVVSTKGRGADVALFFNELGYNYFFFDFSTMRVTRNCYILCSKPTYHVG